MDTIDGDAIETLEPDDTPKEQELYTVETHTVEAYSEAPLSQRFAAGAIDLSAVFVLFHIIQWLLPQQLHLHKVWQLDALLLWILYHACFESSRLQATPGKYLMALQVVGKYGTRLTFLDACVSKFGFLLLCLTAPLALQMGIGLSVMYGVLALLAIVLMSGASAYQKIRDPKETEIDQLLVTPTDDDPLPARDTATPEATIATAVKEPVLQRPDFKDNTTVTRRPSYITIQLPVATTDTTWED